MDLSAFGNRFAQGVEVALAELKQARPNEEGWQRPIDLLIVSGDIAEVAKPSEFESGRLFLTAVAKGLGIDVHRTIFVPGNHDFSWAQCKRIDLDLEEESITAAEHEAKIHAAKFTHYQKFLSDYYALAGAQLTDLPGRTLLHAPTGAYLHDLTLGGCPVSIAALNTSETETHKRYGGELSQAQAEPLIKAWTSPKYTGYLKIAIVHHNPLASPPANLKWSEEWVTQLIKDKKLDVTADWLQHYIADMAGFQGTEHLQRIVNDASAHLILHGHHHSPTSPVMWKRKEKGVAPILSVGSLGLNPDQIPTDQPLTCQLILFQVDPTPQLVAFPLTFDPNFRLTGELNLGQFRLDLKSESVYDDSLPLPKGWEAKKVGTVASEDHSELTKFVAYYRQRVSGLHSSYDLKNLGVLPGERGKANNPQLDDLYLPLRFAPEYDIRKTDQGSILALNSLLRLLKQSPTARQKTKSRKQEELPLMRGQSLAITGAAGAGKTTWMRYTFRRMREDSRTLPFLIELRSLALFWRDNPLDKSSIEAYLESWITRQAPEFGTSPITLSDLLSAPQDWLPVLLVDGWDELGDVGTEFRDQLLGLMERYPHLLVIASSRPYGTARPTSSDAFVNLQVQPLSAEEIEAFSTRFYQKCYGDEPELTIKQATAFGAALARSEDAKLLAKTPLLLTMMLYISRSMRLPDKRHQLYEACLLSLLSERPAMQMEEGAQLLAGQWCPSEEGPARMQIVAQMAHDLQTNHEQNQNREGRNVASSDSTPIVVSKETLKLYLPEIWTPQQREGFLLWLCGRAGVMVDDVQDNINFAHLSFQEFLTAWHLNYNVVGSDAEALFVKLSPLPSWWETLLLWISLLNDKSSPRAEELLAHLMEQGNILLVGMMLADGIGSEEQMTKWSDSLGTLLLEEWPEQLDRCLRAWQASRQEERRNYLGQKLRAIATRAHWRAILSINEVLHAIGQEVIKQPKLELPESVIQAPIQFIQKYIHNETIQLTSRREFALARSLMGVSLLWPNYLVSLLTLWPSERQRLSFYVQRMVSMGKPLEEVFFKGIEGLKIAVQNYVPKSIKNIAHTRLQNTTSFITLSRPFALALDIAKALDLALASDISIAEGNFLENYYANNLGNQLATNLSLSLKQIADIDTDKITAFAKDILTKGYIFSAAEISPTYTSLLAHNYNRRKENNYCLWSAATRSALSTLIVRKANSETIPLLLLTEAARYSITTGKEGQRELSKALALAARNQCDPLWIALSRHISRLSTEEDRDLLRDLATHPGKRLGILSWGLQYIVRGDLLLANGEEITLDALCDKYGMPHFPLLDDMEPELIAPIPASNSV